MSNEPIKLFRTTVLGGFDRRDVIDYVKALSDERNKYKAELAAARAEADAVRAESDAAKASCAAAVRNANAAADDVIARVRAGADERVSAAYAEAERARRELRAYQIKAVADAAERLRAVEDGVRALREGLSK